MATHLHRSVDRPIRERLSWDEMWRGPDQGLIRCWERGRQKRVEEPHLAARAERGELVVLAWKGGVEGRRKDERKKPGTLRYMATWQGLRGDDLAICLDGASVLVCARTGQVVEFSGRLPLDDE